MAQKFFERMYKHLEEKKEPDSSPESIYYRYILYAAEHNNGKSFSVGDTRISSLAAMLEKELTNQLRISEDMLRRLCNVAIMIKLHTNTNVIVEHHQTQTSHSIGFDIIKDAAAHAFHERKILGEDY